MREVTGAEGLRRGEAVFKARKPKEAKYALPKRYQSGADKRDYYHVGVVVSASPLEIVHCTGPGIVRDHALGKWRYAGWLRRVTGEAGEQAPMVCQAVVATPNGEAACEADEEMRPILGNPLRGAGGGTGDRDWERGMVAGTARREDWLHIGNIFTQGGLTRWRTHGTRW